MVATSSLQLVNDLAVITQYSELVPYGTTTPTYTQQTIYHVPFFTWLIIATVFLIIIKRILKEFLIRWRN